MAYFTILELIAKHKIWSNEYTFAVARTTGGATGIGPFANGNVVGVGREKQVANSLTCVPPRKIRHQFQECKHTSLTFLVVYSPK
jgi:hypothetical protein